MISKANKINIKNIPFKHCFYIQITNFAISNLNNIIMKFLHLFWKSQIVCIFLLSYALTSCTSPQQYTMENSRFIGKMGRNDTLKVINKRDYCENGPTTESYYFYYPNQSKVMECHFQMENRWGKKVAEQGIIKEEIYKVSSKAIKYFLKFERDVINEDTGNEGVCTFSEHFDIILKNDTASSSHNSCQYEGFEKLVIELTKNTISEEKKE